MNSVWLAYHDIHDGSRARNIPTSAAMYHVSSELFSRHLECIKSSGHRVVTVGEFVSSPDLRTDSVVLTFDDGWQGAFATALPLLVRIGWPATFFVTSGFVGRPGFCDAQMLQDAVSAGMEIGIHGTTHRMLSSCSKPEITGELQVCKGFLESLLQRSIQHASVPGGSTNRLVSECAAELGLQSLSTSRPGINSPVQPHYDLRRMAIRSSTRASDVDRYCRHAVKRETARWAMLQLPRRVLGMRNYARLRQRLMSGSEGTDALFQP
jgi:peptidoglycan/xylan/chitin deacetylase (PgdA/CDA1 family)